MDDLRIERALEYVPAGLTTARLQLLSSKSMAHKIDNAHRDIAAASQALAEAQVVLNKAFYELSVLLHDQGHAVQTATKHYEYEYREDEGLLDRAERLYSEAAQ